MRCKKCDSEMKRVEVGVRGANSKAVSYQCPNCEYFEFEPESSKRIIKDIRDRKV